MKIWKRVLRWMTPVVAAAVLLLSLSLALVETFFAPVLRAGAAGSGSITVTNAQVGSTYTAYRLFDATLDTSDPDDVKIAYQATAAQKAYYEALTGNVFAFTATTSEDVYIVSVREDMGDLSESDVTDYIRSLVLDGTMDEMTAQGLVTLVATLAAEDTEIVLTGLPYGYYYVTSSLGSLIAVTSTAPDVSIEEKNDAPSLDKEVSSSPDGPYTKENEVQVGDRIFFRITIEATPGAAGYVLHDVMSPGLTLDADSIAVTADGEVLTEGVEYTLVMDRLLLRPDDDNEETEDGCTFEIIFDEDYLTAIDQNTTILVTYSAIVNEDAVIGDPGNLNTATLDYGDSTTWSTEPSETITRIPPEPTEGTTGGGGSGGSSSDGKDTTEESAEIPEEETEAEGEGMELIHLIEAGSTLSPAIVGTAEGLDTLPQTGQLNWPVPILAALGMLLFLLGVFLNRGERKENG